MPDMNGYEVIKMLKADARYAGIPVIFVTAKAEEMSELSGLSLGAVDYVTKPFSSAILLKRIENHLIMAKQKTTLSKLNDSLVDILKEKTAQISGLQNLVVKIVTELVEFRGTPPGGHISRTKKYMELLIGRMVKDGVYADEVLTWKDKEFIAASAQLHDIGKIFVSDAILNKPGELSADEFGVVKTHAEKGAAALRQLETNNDEQLFFKYAETIAAAHHEKWDGSGYPQGLKGEDIPLLGRLMAIADVYDALTSVRPYKEAFTPEKSAKIIIEGSGTHFDPALVGLFVKLEDEFAAVAKTDNENK